MILNKKKKANLFECLKSVSLIPARFKASWYFFSRVCFKFVSSSCSIWSLRPWRPFFMFSSSFSYSSSRDFCSSLNQTNNFKNMFHLTWNSNRKSYLFLRASLSKFLLLSRGSNLIFSWIWSCIFFSFIFFIFSICSCCSSFLTISLSFSLQK